MDTNPHKGEKADGTGPSPGGPSDVVLLLTSADASLARAWQAIEPPHGFRLRTAPRVEPGHLTSGEAMLVLVDAEAALAADEALADALRTAAARCVWTGTAPQIERLGPVAIEAAYDLVVTPTGARVLARRVADWARNIQRTAAVETLGRRVDELAEQHGRLAARLDEVETENVALARQRARLDQALRRIHQVARLSREINSLNLDRIVAVCVERLPALVEARRASLYLYDAAADRLILQGQSQGLSIAKRVDLRESPQSPMAVAVRRGELLLVGEFQEFERAADVKIEREFKDQYATTSCVVVPLKGGGRVRGVLNLADKEDGGRFDQDIDLPVVEQVAELIGASIYNVELYQEMERRAKTDPLTSLTNRRGVEESLAREAERSRRYGSLLTVLMIDVDQLKDINDRVGHPAGDAVLRNLASVLLEAVRSVDVPGRWAGDEFVVVLSDTSAAQAEQLARRLLVRMRDKPACFGQESLPTSLSIGVAQYQKGETLESLIHRVDQALYAAKHGGRNQIATAAAPPAP